MQTPTPNGIEAAYAAIDPQFRDMPIESRPALDDALSATILLKDETANPIHCFKGRGATWFMQGIADARPLVCGSAGNFGQGLAWAAQRHGLSLTVFTATDAVPAKIAAMRRLGADIRSVGTDYDDAKQRAEAHARAAGAAYVEDGAEHRIAEGVGTIALELTRAGLGFDTLLVPLGNGALAAGVGTWLRGAAPHVSLVAVAAGGAPAMADAVLGNAPDTVARAATIADGIAVRVPIPGAVATVCDVVDDVVLVGEDAIHRAMALVAHHLGRRIEAAAAVPFAALIEHPSRWCGRRIAIPLTGANTAA